MAARDLEDLLEKFKEKGAWLKRPCACTDVACRRETVPQRNQNGIRIKEKNTRHVIKVGYLTEGLGMLGRNTVVISKDKTTEFQNLMEKATKNKEFWKSNERYLKEHKEDLDKLEELYK